MVSRGMARTRNKGSYAIGVGVEDPVFVGRNSGSEKDELKRWAPILSEFQIVSVRGPRSAELLSGIGLRCAGIGRSGTSASATRCSSRRRPHRGKPRFWRRSLGTRSSKVGRRVVGRREASFVTRLPACWDTHEPRRQTVDRSGTQGYRCRHRYSGRRQCRSTGASSLQCRHRQPASRGDLGIAFRNACYLPRVSTEVQRLRALY